MIPRIKARVRAQTLSWAMGLPRHNMVDDECCPDFSCCHSEFFTESAEARWALYRKEHHEQ